MSVLARYVIRAVLTYTFMVMMVLLVLSGLYLFITQQDDIGTGTYALADAFAFVGLNLPQYAFELLPIGALIGALIGLGNLARSSELAVMRAAGVSVFRIAGWCAVGGLVLVGVTWVLGEYVAPPLEQYARQQKTFAKYSDFTVAAGRSVWAKDGRTFLSVQQQSAENRFGGVYVFRFDEQRRLQSVGRADTASVGPENRWQLENYEESRIEGDRVVVSRQPVADFRTRLSPDFLGLAVVSPESLPVAGLRQYIDHLRQNGLDSTRYETALWSRIARTVALLAVVLLAVPFAFGTMRSTGAGARTVVGILIGAMFFLLTKTLESGGQLFQLDPFVVAWAPTLLLTAVSLLAIARVR